MIRNPWYILKQLVRIVKQKEGLKGKIGIFPTHLATYNPQGKIFFLENLHSKSSRQKSNPNPNNYSSHAKIFPIPSTASVYPKQSSCISQAQPLYNPNRALLYHRHSFCFCITQVQQLHITDTSPVYLKYCSCISQAELFYITGTAPVYPKQSSFILQA